jgi:hypothetical protein
MKIIHEQLYSDTINTLINDGFIINYTENKKVVLQKENVHVEVCLL